MVKNLLNTTVQYIKLEEPSDKFELEAKSDLTGSNFNKEEGASRNASSFAAYFNVVCVVAGTGTLGLPLTLHQGGWIVLLLFLIIAVCTVYTSKLLIECLYYDNNRRLQEFPDIGEAAFGKLGRYVVTVFHYSILLSTACIYILLTGLNCSRLVADLNYGDPVLPLKVYILLSGIVILVPSAALKTLKEVAVLAAFGALATLVVVLLVVVLGGYEFSRLTVQPQTSFINWSGIPIAIATAAFSYGGNAVYPHVEATMRNPKAWLTVMICSAATITTMYVTVAATGYLYYGSLVQSPILDSLPKGIGSLTSYLLITLHVILAAPIYICSFCLEQERYFKIDLNYMDKNKEFTFRVVLRTIVTGILTIIAMFLPYFSDLMALVGAVSNCVIVFLIPIACHYKLFGWAKRPKWEYILTTIVIIIGLVGLILGTYSAMSTLIEHIKLGKSTTTKFSH